MGVASRSVSFEEFINKEASPEHQRFPFVGFRDLFRRTLSSSHRVPADSVDAFMKPFVPPSFVFIAVAASD